MNSQDVEETEVYDNSHAKQITEKQTKDATLEGKIVPEELQNVKVINSGRRVYATPYGIPKNTRNFAKMLSPNDQPDLENARKKLKK